MYRIHLRRSAFTLIEMLVVIAIIAVLASLLLVGVMAILRKGPEVKNRNDILQLSEGLQRFYAKHKFYPPDRIKLCSKWSNYTPGNPLDALSMSYLGTIWPNLDRTQTFNWGGGAAFTEGVILEGDQCLVFFLGGMPNGAGLPPQPFFNNPANPTVAIGTSTDRVKYFDFDGARCVPMRGAGNPFPSYLDSHAINNDNVSRKKSPFIYFSSGKRPDGYTMTPNSITIFPASNPTGTIPYIQQLPTATSPAKFYNSTSFQLISAGPDGFFGPGGAWTPGGGNLATKDDISNFSDNNLGV
jgi:prepilin-type N-terminal cleavage/methylation domain-containing protein